MIKILLVTLQGGSNYGNRLQNYALQTVVERLECEVHNPCYYFEREVFIKERIKHPIRVVLGFLHFSRFRQLYCKMRRERTFRRFDKKYIHNRFRLSFEKAFLKDWRAYDAAISGSDQVWHRWHVLPKELEYFYLMFFPEAKRLTYAPSFGFEQFDPETIQIHKRGLVGIRKLSCREKTAQTLIRELTGREAEVLCDPTLLLTADEWQGISQKPRYSIPEHYVLEYFITDMDQELLEKTAKFAAEKGLPIINVFDCSDLTRFCTSPEEFLWLVNHADYVLTNSFHGCVFSILFYTKFVVFGRGGEEKDTMFDRIRTLLHNFGMERRIYNGSIDVADEAIEMEALEAVLNTQRMTAQVYLDECAELWKK